MNNPDPNNTNNTDTNETKSWWSKFTSAPVVEDSSDFDPDKFAQEVEEASWLDIFKKKS